MALQADLRADIVNKATGAVTEVSVDAIDVSVPSVVRLNVDRAAVASMTRDGDDLLLRLVDGREIRIADFYEAGGGAGSDVVLQGQDGQRWLAQLTQDGTRFTLLEDGTELVAAAGGAGGGAMSGAGLIALLGGVAVAGGIAAAAGGGGDADDSPNLPGTPPDTTAPARPTAAFTAGGAAVTGTGEAGASVEVRGANGEVIGRGTVGADGNFSVPVNPPRTNGEAVNVVQTDAAGNASPPASVTAPDLTAPAAPTATVSDTGTSVSGTGEPGATVTVTDAAGATIGSATVGADGRYTVPLTPAQANGGTLTVVQSDAAGNASSAVTVGAPDLTAPAAPTVVVSPDGTAVTGTGEPGATVTVTDAAGTSVGSGTVGADGSYTVPLTPAQDNGGTLTVVQTDAGGNASLAVTVDTPDLTGPTAPTVVVAPDGTAVTGTGEPGATVTVTDAAGTPVGSGTVGADGSYTVPLTPAQDDGGTLTVVQTDPAGNPSPAVSVTAPDATAPEAPTAVLADDGTSVTGTGEAGATISVTAADGTVLGTATVAADGSYTAVLTPAQINNETISVVQADAAGNVSPAIALVAPDLTAPATPSAAIDPTGVVITGTGEPGATVTVSEAGGAVLGTALVNEAGAYTVVLSTALIASEAITVIQADAAGNVSPGIALIAPDLTPPAPAIAAVSDDGTIVVGEGEPGAAVMVMDPSGVVLGTAECRDDGTFTVVLAEPQINGETLSVVQIDEAGNASEPTAVQAPDLVPGDSPDAPTAVLSDDGAVVTGVALPNATVTVLGASGVVLGTAIAAADGSYTVPLTAAQLNGETLNVVQDDAEGDRSPPTTLTAPDVTAPGAPTAALDGAGVSVTGTGEPGATVTVTAADGTVLGTATVLANGNYTVVLSPAQVDGQTIAVSQADAAGNASPAIALVAPDFTAPAAPTATIDPTGTVITGTGEPGATITITDATGTVIATGIVTPAGDFAVALPEAQIDSQTLSVAQTDAAGNGSASTSVTAPDLTAPAAVSAAVAADGASVTGVGEAGATVIVTDPLGVEIGRALVAADGSYTVALTPAQTNGEILAVAQVDAAGNASAPTSAVAPDLVVDDSPDAPTATLSADGASVVGVAAAGNTVTVTGAGGVVLGTAVAAADGSYTVALGVAQLNGETLQVVQTDADGDVSPPTSVVASDVTAPGAPTAVLDGAGVSVTGTGEPGATVSVVAADGTVIGTAIVDANGNYAAVLTPAQVDGQALSVTQSDPAGNVSPAVALTAPDFTAPAAPTIVINTDGTAASGIGEPGATVTITGPDGTVLGTAIVAADGSYSSPLTPAQINGETVSASQSDTAGNASGSASAVAPDFVAPLAPTATLAADGASVTGTGEPGATVSVTAADGTVLGSAIVAADGSYTAVLTPAQIDSQVLTVVQTDAAGNGSPSVSLTAPDLTAPAAPTIVITADGTAVSGVGEPGATVTITGAGGTVLGTAVVAADGSYISALSPAQINGETVSATQTDVAGNLSGVAITIAPDLVAPAAPAAVLAADGTSVTGTGEPGATISVTAADGTILGTAIVAADGSYTAVLTAAQINNQALLVVQTDAAGNGSPATALVAPDLTAPAAPTIVVSADGTTASGVGEPGATVTITGPDGAVLGTATVAANGSYTTALIPPQVEGQTVSASQTDDAGNPSDTATTLAPDLVAPTGLTAVLAGDGASVSGVGEPNATVTVRASDGTVLGTTTIAVDGSYTAAVTPAQIDNQTITVVQADAAGNASPAITLVAPDLTPPAAPVAAIDATGNVVSGTGEPSTTVTVSDAAGGVLATGTVNAAGNFSVVLPDAQIASQPLSVTLTDAAGNPSPATPLTAPDLTPPAAATATVAADGASVSGVGEGGATVIVTDPLGTEIGRVVAAADGSYTVALTPAQVNGETLSVRQVDAAGNVSPATTTTAPDLVVGDTPDAPTAILSADGASVSGIALPNATVQVSGAGGVVIGTAVAAPDGSYTVPLTTAQLNGETLQVVQFDAEGDRSPPTTLVAPDVTPPAVPTAVLDDAGASVSGTGEAGATVTIAAVDGTVLGTAVVGANGNYTAVLTPAQVNGETLIATQRDAAGNVSPDVTLVAPDLTAPAAPVATLSPDGTQLTGTGEPGTNVTVTNDDGVVVGTGGVGNDGTFAIAIAPPQANGEVLGVTLTDGGGNVSPATVITAADTTAPAAPTITVNGDGTAVAGRGEPGATVTIIDPAGAVIGTATVTAAGTYSATLSTAQVNGQLLTATQSDVAGNVSPTATGTAPDLVAPTAPSATVSADGTVVTGVGEPGARIVISDPAGTTVGIAQVAADGSYSATLTPPQANGQLLSVEQSDAAGNVSPTISAQAPDITAPAAPTGTVSANGTLLTGTGEPGASVTITAPGGATIGTATVAANGSFSVLLSPAQTNGETLGIVQRDAAGNPSPTASAVAPDLTAPAAPTAIVAADGTSVSGIGEAGATVTVRDAAGTVIGTAVVSGDGSYTAPLSPAQANGGTLSVAQFDAAGNPSPATAVAAPDITAPIAPTATVAADGTSVTGTGEAGTTVTVTTAAGDPLGSAVVGADGTYTVPLSPVQANGEQVRVTATDGAGNDSPTITVAAPDITAPAAPTATVSPGGATVTGTGEPGATVTVSGPTGPLGSAVVAADGSFTVPLSTPQTDGQALTVVQSDTAGNPSAPTIAVAPDSTAPQVPTATVNADGTAVTGTGVAGSTITVTAAGGAVLGSAVVADDGSYSATLTTPQRNGETLGVTQADTAGNVSPRVPVVAPDITPPAAPTLAISADGTTVSGTGEPGATVTITAGGATIGTAIVAADGSYFATLTTPQANGGTLSAVQADTAGNPSPATTIAAPDITPPAAPTGLAVSADGTTVTGTGEAGTTVTIRDANGTVIGSGPVDAGGAFTVALTTPQVTGATLSATLTDPAGNPSPAATVVAPFDIDAFDNTATANVDLLPVTTAVNYGTANYTALVSLGVLDLDANVLGTPSVGFTVQPGHQFNATFTYDALLSLGVASGYSVVVQRFDGTNWVAVTGTGEASLVQLSLLGGDLVANQSFGPGQYRAFLTFEGTLGAGLLGSLNVSGQDADFTDIGGVTATAVSGNVITDPGAGGEIDVVSPATVVGSVTINGVTTAITADGTPVDGAYGTLVINRDGSYTYTPDASAGVIGQTEQVTYTLFNPTSGEQESATLAIAIGSGDITAAPVAVGDAAVTTVTYQNVTETVAPAVEFGFSTGGAVLFPVTGSDSDTFTVAPGATADVTIAAVRSSSLLTLLPTYTITVTDSTGAVVRTVTQTSLANLSVAPGLIGAGVAVTLDNLPAGTYSYTVSSTNIVGTSYATNVYVGQTTTFLNQFELSSSTVASGSLLANDTVGTDFPVVRVNTGASFEEVGNAPLNIAGQYGTLTVDEVGNYTYRADADLPFSATDLVDSFTYQLVQPNGVLSTATLNVTVDGRLAPAAVTAEPLENDVISLAAFDGQVLEATVVLGEAPAAPDLAASVPAEPDELASVLGAYLDQAEPAAVPAVSEPAEAIATADLAAVSDPLDYLVLPEDLDRHQMAGSSLY